MSTTRIRIGTAPHSPKQELLMNAFFIPGLLEMWVACGTKFGKTWGGSTAMCLAAPINPQALYRWCAPIYSQSKIGYRNIKRMLPPEPYTKHNESGLLIKIPEIDTMIQFCHGQDPESLEGEACHGYILDEASKMKEEVYSSVKTTTTVTQGPIIGISTPRGKNSWFYRKCMEAKEEMIRAKHEGRRPTKIFIHAPSWTNPHVSMDVINDAKKTIPSRLWSQYYGAEFISEGSCFTGFDRCWITDFMEYRDDFLWVHEDADKADVVIGVDWARNVDFSVFTAMEAKTKRVLGIHRMRGLAYPTQIQRLKAFTKNFNTVETIWHDKTGVGVALDDLLGQTELPFRGITFTNASKNEMMVKLMVAFEERAVGLPQINVLANELNDLEIKTTLTGLPTYSAPDGATDDMVMSLALSHAAMLQYVDRDFSILNI